MQLVFLHYHLNRGGVTSVIENHLRSLALLDADSAPTKVSIVYGGREAGWDPGIAKKLPFECNLAVAPELEYDHLQDNSGNLLSSLKSILVDFDRDSTVLHVHNHCLGKNPAILSAISSLAEEGWRLLLQIHDFAEDLRPANYQHMLSSCGSSQQLRKNLYPQAKQIHYAVLNKRDYKNLINSGVDQKQLHLLANPVKSPLQHATSTRQFANIKQVLVEALRIPDKHRIVLYPVRAIRRKNLGEILLWSMLVENTTFLVTLAPLNPQETKPYLQWKNFSEELSLPVQFDTASKCDLPFNSVYAAADAIITTSVAEGFGMVYLEASLARKPLLGRILPDICSDFISAGVRFPCMTEELLIPSDCFDLNALFETRSRLLNKVRLAYGLLPLNEKDIHPSDFGLASDTIDFGRLGVNEQKLILKHVKEDADFRDTIIGMNPQISVSIIEGESSDTIDHNQRVIADNYSVEVVGRKLSTIYKEVLSSSVEPVEYLPEIANLVLRNFLHPRHLFLLRLES